MFGLMLHLIGAGGSRLVGWGLSLAFWIVTRPGGWAVLALGALVWAGGAHVK